MDAVEILLSYVVGFSVSVSLILGYIEESTRKTTLVDGGWNTEQSTPEEFQSAENNYDNNDEKDGRGDTEQLTPEEFTSAEIAETNCDNDGCEKEVIFDDDLGWEGIERSELERVFGEALVFVSSECTGGGGGDRIHRDLKMELYALSKIALEGPCFRSQPVAFKLSARSKWNAWRKLGNMSREAAMEKYIGILSKAIPGWMAGLEEG